MWALAVVVGLAVSACGGSSSNNPAAVSLPVAVKKTEQIPTGRAIATLSASQGGQTVNLLSYRYVFDNPGRIIAATADYRNIVAHEPDALEVAKAADWVFQLVVDSRRATILYWGWLAFLNPSFQKHMPPALRGREWMRADLSALLTTRAAHLGAQVRAEVTAALPGVGSPLLVLGALSTQSASRDGTELVAGTQTQRFRTTADMSRTAAMGRLVTKIAQVAGSRWRVEVWVDGSSLVRRVRFTSPPVPSQGNATYTITYDTSGLAAPVTIQVPPTNKVFDITALGS